VNKAGAVAKTAEGVGDVLPGGFDPAEAPEGDPMRGDEILKRMLQTKPKQHKELVKERKAKKKDKDA